MQEHREKEDAKAEAERQKELQKVAPQKMEIEDQKAPAQQPLSTAQKSADQATSQVASN